MGADREGIMTKLLLSALLLACASTQAETLNADFTAGIDSRFAVLQERDFWIVATDATHGLVVSKGYLINLGHCCQSIITHRYLRAVPNQ